MGLILNATKEEQKVKVFGNWFTLKPGQIKQFQDNIAAFMDKERGINGLIQLPDTFEEMEYRASDEGKALLAEFEQKGVDRYLKNLRQVIYNNQVSLRSDLEKANQKVDPASLATDGEIAAMRIVAKYDNAERDREQAKIEEVKKLMAQVK